MIARSSIRSEEAELISALFVKDDGKWVDHRNPHPLIDETQPVFGQVRMNLRPPCPLDRLEDVLGSAMGLMLSTHHDKRLVFEILRSKNVVCRQVVTFESGS